MALSDADAELGRLDGLAANLPDPELLIAPFLRREAVSSSRIEGTRTTFSELVLFEAADDLNESGDAREVSNYIDALKYGVRRVEETGICRRLLLEIHQKLMAHADADSTLPGQFRTRQVFIAPQGQSISNARYVPPPALAVPPAVDNLFEYFHQPDRLPLLVRLAIMHYQFEAIHPFIDGNGRMGRLLIVLMLCQQRRLAAPMLYLSAYFEWRRSQYNDLMLAVSQKGDWESWITFFLNGIAEQAKDAIIRTRQLHNLRGEYRRRLTGARRSTSTLTLVEGLFRFPVLTTRLAVRTLGITNTAAMENIQKLVDAQIVQFAYSRGRRQYFLAGDIIEIIDRAQADPLANDEIMPPPELLVTQSST